MFVNSISTSIAQRLRLSFSMSSVVVPKKIRTMLTKLKSSPELEPDLQDMLCDQLSQYTKQELLSDV